MKLATFSAGDGSRIGIVTGEGVIDVARHLERAPRGMIELMGRWSEFAAAFAGLAVRGADLPLAAITLQAPVPRPGKIMAIGLNYADHCAETKMALPKEQIWFSKAATAANGPYAPIELPAVSEQLDHEAELVFVIGRRCRNLTLSQAKQVIFGYCVGNDVSVRDWQMRTSQWVIGKSFDTHAPFGPWITTADAVDPRALDVRLWVNGELRQSSNTRHLVFDCYAQVACLSQAMTLEPGDVVYSGTCGGVGMAADPPRWLKRGDRVRVEIAGLGAIENRVEAGDGKARLG